jgi:hypothetical protein
MFCDRLHINTINFMRALVLLRSLHMKKPTKLMRIYLTAKGLRRIGLPLTFFLLYSSHCLTQETNSSASGRVYSNENEKIPGVTRYGNWNFRFVTRNMKICSTSTTKAFGQRRSISISVGNSLKVACCIFFHTRSSV